MSKKNELHSSQIGAVSVHRFHGEVPDPLILGEPDFFQKPELKLPQRGVTVMYGHRGSANVLRAAMKQMTDEDSLAIVSFKVGIGKWNPNKLKLSDLHESRFLNLPSRSSAQLMDDIKERWNEWLTKDGLPVENFPRQPSNYMHYLDRLVELDEYKDVVAIAYDVHTTVGIAKFMTIFDTDAIDVESVVVGPGLDVEVQI